MSQRLRIALISEHASPLAGIGGVDAGGQNIYVAEVAKCLAALGHTVDVFTRRDDAGLPAVADMRPGVRVFHIPAGPPCFVPKEALLPHMPEFARAVERLMRNSVPYDLAHANFFMSGMVAERLKQRLGLPFVITFHALGLVRRLHQQHADAFPAARTEIERRLVRTADAVIAECPQDADDLTGLYGAVADRLSMVPCGYSDEEFAPASKAAARTRLGLAADEFVILQLGRLVPRKGIDNVIRSLAHLPASVPARLLVVGGDSSTPDPVRTPEIARLLQVASDCGVADRVRFTGQRRRAELKHYYAAADVFVTTPWYEPFGITPLEAMACGAPVIASDVGGLRYSVVDGVSGFLVPPHAPHALADRLAALHRQPLLAAAFGRAGLHRARALFTWERVAGQLAAVYEGVCREAAAPLPAASVGWTATLPGLVASTGGDSRRPAALSIDARRQAALVPETRRPGPLGTTSLGAAPLSSAGAVQ